MMKPLSLYLAVYNVKIFVLSEGCHFLRGGALCTLNIMSPGRVGNNYG